MSFELGPEFRFFPIPTDLHFGHVVLARLPEQVRALGGRGALVVTDAGVRRTGVVDRALDLLRSAGLAAAVYDGVQADSGSGQITEAAARLRDASLDVVVDLAALLRRVL